MRDGQVYGALNEVFHEVFADDDIVVGPATAAKDIEDWDSLRHINLMIAIESRFGVKFMSSEIERLTNVGDIVKIIEARGNV